MRRRSFTPRFASKTIRSLAHFHAAGDEGKALVCKGLFRARGPRRKYFRWGKSHLNESVRTMGSRNVTSYDTTLSSSKLSRRRVLVQSLLEHAEHSFEDGLTRRSPASQSARIRRHAPRCGGWLVCRAVAPLRVVKMRRCSLTPRFASKTIRSLAHFHDAGDEGNALVIIRRQSRRLQVAAIRGPRRKYFRWGKDVRPRKPDG